MSWALDINSVSVRYDTANGALDAVRGVSLQVAAGQCLGLVGESGCGKSTLGKSVVGLAPLRGGSIAISGVCVSGLSARELRPLRHLAQMVFQDPQSSLNPRLTVGTLIEEPLIVNGLGGNSRECKARVVETLRLVGLPSDVLNRYPHEFSGGQRQRISIARALVLAPELIVADECVSALDVSMQAQIINLLIRLKTELGLAMLFISHDLGVVQIIAERIAVMYLGRIVEVGLRHAFWARPLHPYTRALLDAVPLPDPSHARAGTARLMIEGEVPSPYQPPGGCAFHPRCPAAQAQCRVTQPPLQRFDDGSEVACHKVIRDNHGHPQALWAVTYPTDKRPSV